MLDSMTTGDSSSVARRDTIGSQRPVVLGCFAVAAAFSARRRGSCPLTTSGRMRSALITRSRMPVPAPGRARSTTCDAQDQRTDGDGCSGGSSQTARRAAWSRRPRAADHEFARRAPPERVHIALSVRGCFMSSNVMTRARSRKRADDHGTRCSAARSPWATPRRCGAPTAPARDR